MWLDCVFDAYSTATCRCSLRRTDHNRHRKNAKVDSGQSQPATSLPTGSMFKIIRTRQQMAGLIQMLPYLDESTPPSDYLPTKRAQYKVFHLTFAFSPRALYQALFGWDSSFCLVFLDINACYSLFKIEHYA